MALTFAEKRKRGDYIPYIHPSRTHRFKYYANRSRAPNADNTCAARRRACPVRAFPGASWGIGFARGAKKRPDGRKKLLGGGDRRAANAPASLPSAAEDTTSCERRKESSPTTADNARQSWRDRGLSNANSRGGAAACLETSLSNDRTSDHTILHGSAEWLLATNHYF